jgi:hypothetical protein
MSAKPKRHKCRGCSTFFFPDYRNRGHQHYCGKPDCRRASKLASQRRWYRQPKNLSHFRNGEGTARVQAWRKRHPGYWRKKNLVSDHTQTTQDQALNLEQSSRNVLRSLPRALQDYCLAQEPAFIGLLSMFMGSTLQDDIQGFARRLIEQGCSILGRVSPELRDNKQQPCSDYDPQTSLAAQPGASNPQQL